MEIIGELSHIVGSGIKIVNFPAREIHESYDPDYSYLELTPEAEIRSDEIIEYIKKGRGEFISGCVDIEHLLGESISQFFLKDNPKKQEIFHELILDTTFLSFSQKKNILRLIMKKYPDEFKKNTEEERKDFFKKLDNLIKKRNAFAHGEIIIDLNANTVILQYYDSINNKKDKFEISPDFFNEIQQEINSLVIWHYDHRFRSSLM